MYCHSLSANKGKHQVNIQCEDLAIEEKTVGIWLYDLKISGETERELQRVILQWTDTLEERFKIYTSRDEFKYNKYCA